MFFVKPRVDVLQLLKQIVKIYTLKITQINIKHDKKHATPNITNMVWKQLLIMKDYFELTTLIFLITTFTIPIDLLCSLAIHLSVMMDIRET